MIGYLSGIKKPARPSFAGYLRTGQVKFKNLEKIVKKTASCIMNFSEKNHEKDVF
jgi:hypothetical protein